MIRNSAKVFFALAVIFLCGATPTPSPSPFASPSPFPSPYPPVNVTNLTVLLSQFRQAQATEMKALGHRSDFELKELKISQKTRLREWEKREEEARHKFFEEHSKGPERRAYVKDYLQRRDALRKHFAEEKSQRDLELRSRTTAIKQEQDLKLKEFRKYIDGKKIPPTNLWPKAGI